MKIHVVTKYFIPVVAGIEVNILETYKRLARDGWDVTIHTSRNTYLEKEKLPDYEEICGLKVIRYHFGAIGFTPKINYAEKGLIALHNFDVFPHLQIMITQIFKNITKSDTPKLFLTPHGGFNPEWRVFPLIVRVCKYLYTYTLGTLLINLSVDGVRAVSDWENHELVKKGVRKSMVTTISNGLEDEAFREELLNVSSNVKDMVNGWGKYVLDDARIYPIKDQATIIRSLPLLPSDIKFVNIGMVGSSSYHAYLMKLAKKLGVENRVIFPGVIRGEDKYYIYRHALGFVHMAIWESFCNVVHQAISQGLVCFVSNNTALPFLVKNNINGFLIKSGDHMELARKIRLLLDNNNIDFFRQIEKHNKTHGKENSWENVSKRMSDRYKELLSIR